MLAALRPMHRVTAVIDGQRSLIDPKPTVVKVRFWDGRILPMSGANVTISCLSDPNRASVHLTSSSRGMFVAHYTHDVS